MISAGLDLATLSGWGLVDRKLTPDQWRCGTFDCDGDNAEDKAGKLAILFVPWLLEFKPDIVAIETPMRNVKMFKKGGKGGVKRGQLPMKGGSAPAAGVTVNVNALHLSSIAGGAVAICDAMKVPWCAIPSGTWRAAYYGEGVKPHGSDDWKDLAIAYAKRQKIHLPNAQYAQREAAEAIAIAVCWQRATYIPQRWQKAFMQLRMGQRP